MFHFFAEPEQIQEQQIIITGKDVNHIRNVLRMKVGEQLLISCQSEGRDYLCSIRELTDSQIDCEILIQKEEDHELPNQIFLFQGLPKADKMELIIQKAVELGVYEIIPVVTKRSIVKLDEKKAAQKVQRWQGIAEAAAKQSKRGIIPKVHEVISFEQALAYSRTMQVQLIPYEHAEGMMNTKAKLAEIKSGEQIAVFIGPEGGFEESEVQSAKEQGVYPITLGRRILRTETAGLAVLSILMYQLEKDS